MSTEKRDRHIFDTDGLISDELKTQYRALLRSYRDEGIRDPVANRRPWHCKIAIEELVAFGLSQLRKQKQAEPSHDVIMRLLTSSCTNHVYGGSELRGPLEEFLSLGGRLRILIYNEHFNSDGNLLFGLTRHYPGLVEFRSSLTSASGEKLKHFFVVNDQAYRLEAPHIHHRGEDFNDLSPEISARICFNDKEGARNLIEFFDELWGYCSPIAPARRIAPEPATPHM